MTLHARSLAANLMQRTLGSLFPGYYFPGNTKHNHNKDFGFPEHLTFDDLFALWDRDGLAAAIVKKTVGKCWQSEPFLREREGAKAESRLDRELRQRFRDLRIWQRMAEADCRALVGGYAGLILRFADGKTFDQPVERVAGGLEGLVEVIPAWKGQLTPSAWQTDQTQPNYGWPTMFNYNEATVGGTENKVPRAVQIHPDRVLIWSDDGTMHARSLLAAPYNAILSAEKIIGAGGEGFWKNARSSPHLSAKEGVDLNAMAKAMGLTSAEDLLDAMSENVEDWQKGFDKVLMTQGMDAQTLAVTLPSPEHFFGTTLQVIAAAVQMPVKILVGMQTGERASTEDADEWSLTCQSRRTNSVIPGIMDLVNRLEQVGVLPERDWYLEWTDLTESSMPERIDRANKMADTNSKMAGSTGELVFTGEEIRQVVGLDPLTDDEAKVDDPADDADALDADVDPEDEDEDANA